MYTSLQKLKAAKYYNEYQGVKSDMKACTDLINNLGADVVVRMAKERGFQIN